MVPTKIDTIKAIVTYGTVAVVCLGGLGAVVFFDMNPDKLAIVSALVGGALGFLTNGETATRTARSLTAAQNGKSTDA